MCTGYIAAMGKAGGGRNEVDPRFISLFSVYNMAFPTNQVLFHIFSSILSSHVKPFPEHIQDLVSPLTYATLELFEVNLRLHTENMRLRR